MGIRGKKAFNGNLIDTEQERRMEGEGKGVVVMG